MRKLKVLDSYAVLAYLNGEPGAEIVKRALAAAQKEEAALVLSEINAGEVYYILWRKRGRDIADHFIERILPSLPILLQPADFGLILDASRVKAVHSLSFADCFAVATAARFGASILTGDPEFRVVEGQMEIEWLPRQ